MAGYSGTPLVKKLGIKAEHALALLHAPARFEAVLGELPDDVRVQNSRRGTKPFDVILLFVDRRAVLERELPVLAKRLSDSGGIWIAWPKKTSGVPTDVGDGVVRKLDLATGLVDNKVCAIDEVWSGLRFVRRLADRAR